MTDPDARTIPTTSPYSWLKKLQQQGHRKLEVADTYQGTRLGERLLRCWVVLTPEHLPEKYSKDAVSKSLHKIHEKDFTRIFPSLPRNFK